MDQTEMPPFNSSPVQALKAVISSPNWVGNLLWLSLAALAQSIFIGQIGIFGYGAELIQRRAGRPENPTPDIDSQRLGDYISKGIWPFLVQLVVQFGAMFVVAIPIAILVALAVVLGAGIGDDTGAMIGLILIYPLMLAMIIFVNLFSVPFLIRSMVCQDFQQSFDVGWALGFLRIMFWEMLLSSIVFAILCGLLILIGFPLICVGFIPVIGLMMGGWMNLLAQWYEIYLSRGGIPAPSPMDDVIDATMV